MKLEVFVEWDAINLLPVVLIASGTCEDCGASEVEIQIGWLFWGASLAIELPH